MPVMEDIPGGSRFPLQYLSHHGRKVGSGFECSDSVVRHKSGITLTERFSERFGGKKPLAPEKPRNGRSVVEHLFNLLCIHRADKVERFLQTRLFGSAGGRG